MHFQFPAEAKYTSDFFEFQFTKISLNKSIVERLSADQKFK